MIRDLIIALTLVTVLHGAELRIFTSAVASEHDMASASVWNSDGRWIDKEPEQALVQEGQIIREVYRDLKPGKYRIVLEPLGPIGFSYALTETHVNLEKDATASVILIPQAHKDFELPVELLEAFQNFKGTAMWDLSVRYPGFKDKFFQVRAFSDPKDLKNYIHYLRSDGEFTISIWDRDAAKGYAYEKTFRVIDKKESESGPGE